jgi:hypothetical protein
MCRLSCTSCSGGSSSRQTIEHFDEAGLVRITHGGFAIRLEPFGMLDPQIVVNLLLELGVGVDLMIHGYCPGERFKCDAGKFPTKGLAESPTSVGVVSARYGQVRVFQRAARMCLRRVRRQANWVTLYCWRCSNTASSPLCVRVSVNFLIMQSFCFSCPKTT